MVPQIRTPEKRAAGVYANGSGVWFTAMEFTIDFLVSLPVEQGTDPNGNPVMMAPQEVVARVKVPPPLVFEIASNIANAMDGYEKQHGKIPEFTGGGPIGRPPDAPKS
jgi:hypothetical protein